MVILAIFKVLESSLQNSVMNWLELKIEKNTVRIHSE